MVSAIRRSLVDSPSSLGERARTRRWERLAEQFPDLSDMRVVDLGGTVATWARGPVRPAHVVVVNLFGSEIGDELPHVTAVTADACDMSPSQVGTFDLVYSNSLIEHVGGHQRRQRLADVIHQLGEAHWIQTPYRYFPVEPHWLFPGFQFLPVTARAALSRRWPLMHTPCRDRRSAVAAALAVELMSACELEFLFPESRILRERAAGLVKSLVAVRSRR